MRSALAPVQRRAALTASVSTRGGATTACCGRTGQLVEPPFTYRDARTDGVMEQVFAKVSRERVYATTGIQFLWFNTLYQLYAACRNTPETIAASHRFATIPDILNLWLSGTLKAEYTNATTTQCVDAVKRTWATGTARGARTFRRGCCLRSSSRVPCWDRCAGKPTRRWPACQS